MNTLDTFLARSRQVAAQDAAEGLLQPLLPEALPRVKAVVIGCADMRVDPAHVLGLKPGEAVVMRNIGGRVTPGLLAELGMLGRIGQVAQQVPGGGGEFHVIVMQHTDCGITRLANESGMLTQYFQVPEAQLHAKAVLEPRAAVRGDVEILRAVSGLPGEWFVSGIVYDVASGTIDTVVPPQPIAV